MKRGISLIAVLMFMLASTTASVVLYKWLSSEGFASGARLKQSEAYQASESGFDAVQAWLSYKAADAGMILGDYLSPTKNPNKNPYAILSSEKFKVYLMGADTATKGKPYKMKFMSIGKGRDESEVRQTAIFNVEGLYVIEVPRFPPSVKKYKPVTYNDDFWGEGGTFGFLQSMRAVITTTPAMLNAGGQAANTIKIGKSRTEPGYLVIDGDYYANNGAEIFGDVYATGNLDFCGGNPDFITGSLYVGGEFHPKSAFTIDGDAYFNGGVDPNKTINDAAGQGTGGCIGGTMPGVVYIGGNSTIKSHFRYYNALQSEGLGFHVNNNLVMDGTIYLTRNSGWADGGWQNMKDSLSAFGNVYVKNSLMGKIYNYDEDNENNGRKTIPFFGNAGKTVCVPSMIQETENNNPIIKNSNYYYKKSPDSENSNPGTTKNYIRMRTKSTDVRASCTPTGWGADPLDGSKDPDKNLAGKLKEGENPDPKSCKNTPIKFNDEIRTDAMERATPIWTNKTGNTKSCRVETKTINGASVTQMALDWENADLVTELRYCWDHANEPQHLFENKWVVVYLKNHKFSGYTSSLERGNYIIILDPSSIGCDDMLYLPPTGEGAQVMLYLPKGYEGPECHIDYNTNKRQTNARIILANSTKRFNYFIFSDGNLSFDTQGKKLTGNVFMNDCKIMNRPNLKTNPYFISEGNTKLIEALSEIGILLSTDGSSTVIITDPDDPNDPDGGTQPPKPDKYIIPLSPRLKVELESKYISKEKKPTVGEPNASKLVLVMPRALRLPPGAFAPNATTVPREYYNFLPLNGATLPNEPPAKQPSCTNNKAGGPAFPGQGVYTCTFTPLNDGTEISELYVKIEEGESTGGMYGGGTSSGGGDGTSSGSGDGTSSGSGEDASSSSDIEELQAANVVCTLVDKNNASVSTLAVTQGENIKTPRISCTDGTTPSISNVFYSTNMPNSPGASNSWKNPNGTAYYTKTITGPQIITVSNVPCGDGNAECGTITVNMPTCTRAGTDTYVFTDELITPNVVGCSGNIGERTFIPSQGAPLTAETPSWANEDNGIKFLTVSSGTTRRIIYLESFVCDGNTITYDITGNRKTVVDCGDGYLVKSPITCNTNNATGCYEGSNTTPVPRPNVYCDGVLNTTGAAKFFYNTSNPADGWDNPGGTQKFNSTGERPITMESLDCGGTIVKPTYKVSCDNVTIVAKGACN